MKKGKGMTVDETINCLNKAIRKFYDCDVACAPERACVARIAGYMQCMIENEHNNLRVDCEYSRATDGTHKEYVKYLDSEFMYAGQSVKSLKGRIFPDLIVHERGTHTHNLLVVEFKGYWNKSSWHKDELKLKAFTKECPHVNIKKYFYYQRGVFVALGRSEWHLVEFINGEQVSKNKSVTKLQQIRGLL